MNVIDGLAGALWLQPGVVRPNNLRSTRPDWVDRATRGRPAKDLPDTLGRLFSLCGRVHLVCAGLALRAAQLGLGDVPAALRAQLAAQTLRDHLQQVGLSWPAQLAPQWDAIAGLRAWQGALACCPAFARAGQGGSLNEWLQAHVLFMPPADWLANWEQDPVGWLQYWCARTDGVLAQLLQSCRPDAQQPLGAVPALQVHFDDDELRRWAAQLCPAAARQPRWRGACAQTGPWSRLAAAAAPPLDTPWLRLGATLAEAVRLALPDQPGRSGSAWLAMGALPLGPGAGLAWVEMARGVLIHQVVLDHAGDDARVAACNVIAPTDWNFHPEGAFAQLVETLPRRLDGAASRRLGAWVAAYAPCVPLQWDPPTPPSAEA